MHVCASLWDTNTVPLFSQIVEYEDYDNGTEQQVGEYEYEEVYEDRYGPAEREGGDSWNAEVWGPTVARGSMYI